MIKITEIEALCELVKNADVKLYDVPVQSIYELAAYFKSEVKITNERFSTSFKKGLVNVTLTDLPF